MLSLATRVPRWAYLLAAATELAVLWLLSAQPGDGIRAQLPGPSGNLLHVVANAVLAFLLLRAFVGSGGDTPGSAEAWPGLRSATGARVVGFVALWAIVDEAHQFWVPGRVCSVLDIFADVLGGVLVLVWPGQGCGRPRRWPAALTVVVAALAVAIYGWFEEPALDRLLHRFLERIAG